MLSIKFLFNTKHSSIYFKISNLVLNFKYKRYEQCKKFE